MRLHGAKRECRISNIEVKNEESRGLQIVISTKERSLSNEVAANSVRFPIKLGMTARSSKGYGEEVISY